MKIFGRKLRDYDTEIPIEADEIVLVDDNGAGIVLGIYIARTNGKVEIRTNNGVLVVLPRAANLVEIEARWP